MSPTSYLLLYPAIWTAKIQIISGMTSLLTKNKKTLFKSQKSTVKNIVTYCALTPISYSSGMHIITKFAPTKFKRAYGLIQLYKMEQNYGMDGLCHCTDHLLADCGAHGQLLGCRRVYNHGKQSGSRPSTWSTTLSTDRCVFLYFCAGLFLYCAHYQFDVRFFKCVYHSFYVLVPEHSVGQSDLKTTRYHKNKCHRNPGKFRRGRFGFYIYG